MKKLELSVVLATRNEEENIGECLSSVKSIADEIVVFDESSTDKTREIARSFGARVYKVVHEPIFHKTKQKALQRARGKWILQLDADERVSRKLALEIKGVINMSNAEILDYKVEDKKKRKMFLRHQKLLEKKDRRLAGDRGSVAGFFIPRLNYFLGKPLIHAGVYPDGVLRLVKRGKAKFPAKSVHEQIQVDGQVRWLNNDLEHHDSPTFFKYFERLNRYTDLYAETLKVRNISLNYLELFNYSFVKSFLVFLRLYVLHKGFLDGFRGFVWSLFSALHYPIAYFKYWQTEKGKV